MAWGPDNARKWSTLALLAIMGTALTAATNPGFVAIISQKGLNFACQQGAAMLQKDLETIRVPDYSGVFKVKHLGRGSYDFYSMTVDGFHIPNPQISLQPSESLRLSIKDTSIKISGKWKSRKNFLKANGKFGLIIEGVSIRADLQLGNSPTGHITIACIECNSHIDNIRVQISGSMLGWLVRMFHKKIEASLKNTINKKICKITNSSVSSKLQPYIQTIPVVARVDAVAGIDYSLVAPLTTTVEFLEGQLKGEFFWRERGRQSPITPPAMVFNPNSEHMVSLGISEYFFNSAGLTYQESGTLKITVRDQMLPNDSKFRLNTQFLGTFLPKVSMKFPSTEVQLLISALKPPHLLIQSYGLAFSPNLETQASVVFPNSSLVPLFTLDMTADAILELNAEGNRLVGQMKINRLSLELRSSEFGFFQVNLLQAIMDYVMSTVVMSRINERLRKGFPLPLPTGVKLNNFMFQSYQNFLVLGGDIRRS